TDHRSWSPCGMWGCDRSPIAVHALSGIRVSPAIGSLPLSVTTLPMVAPPAGQRVKLRGPLRHQRFLLLMTGMCVSLLGDGVFLVALTWQVYLMSNAPGALSFVGIAISGPQVLFLLLAGA